MSAGNLIDMDHGAAWIGIPQAWVVFDGVEPDSDQDIGVADEDVARLVAEQSDAADEVILQVTRHHAGALERVARPADRCARAGRGVPHRDRCSPARTPTNRTGRSAARIRLGRIDDSLLRVPAPRGDTSDGCNDRRRSSGEVDTSAGSTTAAAPYGAVVAARIALAIASGHVVGVR